MHCLQKIFTRHLQCTSYLCVHKVIWTGNLHSTSLEDIEQRGLVGISVH